MAVLISNKVDFKSKTVTRNKEDHYIMITESIHWENITIISIYAPNIRATKYIKQMLKELKEEINSNIIIVLLLYYFQCIIINVLLYCNRIIYIIEQDFNISHSTMYRSYRKKINKEIADFSNMIDQMNLTHLQIIPPNKSIIQDRKSVV